MTLGTSNFPVADEARRFGATDRAEVSGGGGAGA